MVAVKFNARQGVQAELQYDRTIRRSVKMGDIERKVKLIRKIQTIINMVQHSYNI